MVAKEVSDDSLSAINGGDLGYIARGDMEAAFEEANVFDGVRVEGTEYAEEMVDVIDGHAIEQDQILVRRAAPNEEAGARIPCA